MYLFASDFDNTLYFDSIADSDIKAIEEFQRNGNLFGICTGRSKTGVLRPTAGLVKYDFLILATGSLIYDANDQVIYADEMDKEDLLLLVEKYKDKYQLAYNNFDSYTLVKDVDSKAYIDDNSIFSISLLAPNEREAVRIKREIEYNFKKFEAFQNTKYLDIVKRGNSKGEALKFLAQFYKGYTTAAMGDSYNDLPLLSSVEIPFTFKNSPESLKKRAKHLTSSVAESLSTLLLR